MGFVSFTPAPDSQRGCCCSSWPRPVPSPFPSWCLLLSSFSTKPGSAPPDSASLDVAFCNANWGWQFFLLFCHPWRFAWRIRLESGSHLAPLISPPFFQQPPQIMCNNFAPCKVCGPILLAPCQVYLGSTKTKNEIISLLSLKTIFRQMLFSLILVL